MTYTIYACSGLLFNHESPLRPERFVTRKIINTACRIVRGSNEKLILGNTAIKRDWGWAPEYVAAMWLMLQQEKAEDFVVATGKTYALHEFVAEVFKSLNLKCEEHVITQSDFYRPSDIDISVANPSKAERILGWKALYSMPDIVKMMIEAECNEHKISI
ncbi:GDP-mannose 4,6-dehydratase [sulfur-oxidizing endosymbiont of Gigantopelta aegis]|uniref:GDP-mannose 4,6-dehydratase n=1 Tax=sulfur-oxidizing endosymbiont of Gigantopelta aegis TaxID=2794934 RepID=UPI003CCDF917